MPLTACLLVRKCVEGRQAVRPRIRRSCMSWALRFSVGAFLFILVTAGPARAQATIGVTSTLQVVNPGAGGNGDGLCQLSEAIRAANTNLAVDGCIAGQSGGTDTIELGAPGPFSFDQVDNTAVGSSALPVVTSPILINGFNNSLVRDALGPSFRFFIVQGGSLTITDMSIDNGVIVDGDGGVAYVENGSLTVTRSTLSDSAAGTGRFGGFVALVNSTLNVTDSFFTNGAADAGGGAINGSASVINITNSQMQQGSAGGAGAGGGVIRCFTNCNTTITNSGLTGSADTNGGAIATDSPLSLTRVWISNSFAGTSSTLGAVRGGAIDSSGTVTIQDSLFFSNNANGPDFLPSDGGAIYSTGTLTVSGTTFGGNAAFPISIGTGAQSRGGALFVAGSATITNSTISGNGALELSGGRGGAGIFVRNTATVVLNNVTLTENFNESGIAREAGGAGTVTLRNSILAGNIGVLTVANEPSDCVGTFVSQGHNIFGVNTGCTFTPASGDQVGTSSAPVDPVLGIADESQGVVTGCANLFFCFSLKNVTIRLLITSPAIDAGDAAVPGSGGTSCAPSDQNGVARPVGAACDIGAWEGAAIVPNVDIGLTKADAPDPVSVGGTLTYSLDLDTSLAAENAPAVVVTDTLPTGVNFVSATATGIGSNGTQRGNCAEAAGTVTCTFSSLPLHTIGGGIRGGAGTVAIVVQPTASAASPIINNATITSAGTDPDNTNNAATASTVVTGGATTADLSVTKTDSPDPINLGAGNVTYTLTVSNGGPNSATNVALTDTLPAGVTFVSVSPSGPVCTQAAGTVTCDLGSLVSGGSVTVTIVVTPTASGTLDNSASVTATETDPAPGNNSATASTTVNPSADLSVTKTDSPDPVTVGSNLTYTITVSNAGPSAAAGVSLNDALPAGTTFVSLASAAGWTCTTPAVGAGGTVTCTIANLASGAPAVFTLVVRTTAAGALNNTATVATTTTDPNAANNSATATTTVNPPAATDFTIAASPSSVDVKRGQSGSFTVTLTPTPAGATFGSAIAVTCFVTPQIGTCAASPASVTPGANAGTTTVTVTVPSGGFVFRAPRAPWFSPLLYPVLLIAISATLVMLALLPMRWKRRWTPRRASLVLLLVVIALALGQSACAPSEFLGPSTVTINATSGSLSHSTTVTVNVVR